MTRLLSILILSIGPLSLEAADVNITNVTHATSIASTDWLLGLTNGAGGDSRLIPTSLFPLLSANNTFAGSVNAFSGITATTVNKVAITAPASSATLTIADGKTWTVSRTMTLTSAGDSGVITLPNATATIPATSDNLSVFAATTSAQLAGVLSDEDGNGPFLLAKDNIQTNVTVMDGIMATNKATGQYAQLTNGSLTLAGGSGPGLITLLEGAAPSNPSSGNQALYVDSTSHQISAKPSGGTVSVMVTPDAGTANQFITAISSSGVVSKAAPTFAAIAALGPAGQEFVTNGFTPNLTLAGPSNTVTGVIEANNYHTRTNSGSGVAADFALGVTLLSTNAAFTFLAPVHVDTGNTLYQTTVTFVTNTTAAAVAITGPANVHNTGTQYVTNLTRIDWEVYGGNKFTNAFYLPIF